MRDSLSADDLDGRTALLLLTRVTAGARALFVLPMSTGVVASCLSTGDHRRALHFESRALPFRSGTFDVVVLDMENAAPRSPSVRSETLRELNRVLTPSGRFLLLARHRRVPRDWRNWRAYRVVPPLRQWRKSLATDDHVTVTATACAVLDRARIIELKMLQRTQNDRTSDYRILVLGRREETSPPGNVLEALASQIAVSLGLPDGAVAVERLLVRRIGKTTLIVAGPHARYVARLARTPIAAERGRRNFAALTALRAAAVLPDANRALLPEPVASGHIGPYAYFVESAIEGIARDEYDGWPRGAGWEPAGLQFLSAMHDATKRVQHVDREAFDCLVGAQLREIRRYCPDRFDRIIDELTASLERLLVGETLPFVWSHGDFSAGNCLYDRTRRLAGVVDWELFSDYAWPVLDVLNCMEIPGERNSHATWQRFDAIRAMLRANGPLPPAFAAYLDRLDIPRRILPAMSVIYWVDHVAKRISVRAHDSVWMTKRVLRPLQALGLDHA